MSKEGGKRAARPGLGRRGTESGETPKEGGGASGGERLQKVLAHAGVASRRRAETMIAQGRVSVDGKVVHEAGIKVDPSTTRVEVDGKPLKTEEHVYYLVNKPPGMVTTLKDPEGRPALGDLLKEIPERVYPVGRLDYDAEGVLLVTNDGELANRLMHPKYGVRRTYDAKVRGVPSEATLDRLREGVRLDDGPARTQSVATVGRAKRNTWVRVEVAEGRPHLVKRIFEAVGHPVNRLRRVDYAGLTVDDMTPGTLRALSQREVDLLRDALEYGDASRPGPKRPTGSPKGRRPGRRGSKSPAVAKSGGGGERSR